MRLTEEEKKQISSMTNVGLFLETITKVILFSLERNKTDVLKKLFDFISAFEKSLKGKEKIEFKREMDLMIKKKADQIIRELDNKQLAPEQIQAFLAQMKPDIKQKT